MEVARTVRMRMVAAEVAKVAKAVRMGLMMVVTVVVAVKEALRDSGGERESRRGNGSGK